MYTLPTLRKSSNGTIYCVKMWFVGSAKSLVLNWNALVLCNCCKKPFGSTTVILDADLFRQQLGREE